MMQGTHSPIGCPTLDILCGGGVPHESLIYLYGGPGLGKTTIALAMAKAMGYTVWVDAGHNFDYPYATSQGCDDITIITGVEDISTIIPPLISLIPLIVIDDLTCISNNLARPLEILMKEVVRLLPGSSTTILLTNHVRQCRNGYLPPGGLSPIKYSHLVLELGPHSSRVGSLLEVDIKIVKNTKGPCQGSGTLSLRDGLAREVDIVNTAIRLGIIQQTGSWYRYRDVKVHGHQDLYNLPNIGDIYLEVMKAYDTEEGSYNPHSG